MPKRKFDDGATINGNPEEAALTPASAEAAATSSSSTASNPCGEGQARVKAARLEVAGGTTSNGASCSSASSGGNKRRVRFNGVTVFYFERSQGFSCVPSFGGTTLGMTHRHHATREFSLAEHEQALREQQSQTRQKLAKNAKVTANNKSPTAATPEESEESEEEDDEEDAGIGGADGDEADDYFLQPLGGRDRRQMLKSAGVTVDKDERVECQTIRISRQTCGCSCQGQCLPDTCECARDNVKCQVDRPSFPCGCTANGCANPVGRVEFNPVRVRTHYVQTMMRLRLEQQTRFRGTAVPSPTHFRFDDDGPTYCTPPPPAIYNQSQQSLCGSLVNSELNDSANCALANGGVVVDSNGSMGYAPNNGHLTPTFPAVHTFFYPNQHMQSPAIAALGSNGYAHNTLGHHHPLAMQQHLSTQFSLNSSFSTDSGFDETSSNSSPTTPLPLAALYAHQRQRVDAPNICCANESTTTTIEAPTLEETTAAS